MSIESPTLRTANPVDDRGSGGAEPDHIVEFCPAQERHIKRQIIALPLCGLAAGCSAVATYSTYFDDQLAWLAFPGAVCTLLSSIVAAIMIMECWHAFHVERQNRKEACRILNILHMRRAMSEPSGGAEEGFGQSSSARIPHHGEVS